MSKAFSYELGCESSLIEVDGDYFLMQGNPSPKEEEMFVYREIEDLLNCEKESLDFILKELTKEEGYGYE